MGLIRSGTDTSDSCVTERSRDFKFHERKRKLHLYHTAADIATDEPEPGSSATELRLCNLLYVGQTGLGWIQ
jgi:hypothetical protein